jgi:hypothetical protein
LDVARFETSTSRCQRFEKVRPFTGNRHIPHANFNATYIAGLETKM